MRQTITFVVRSSSDFKPEVMSPWIVSADTEKTRGVETHFLRFLVEENTEYSGREGKIYVTGPDGTRYELTVVQNQKHAVIAAKKLYDVDASGGTITVSLQSNTDYTVSVSGYAWITEETTRALTPSQKTFRIAESADTRQGQIIFKYSSADGTPAVADTVLIAQRVGQTEKVTVPDANFRYFLRKNDYVLSKPGETVCEMTAKGKNLASMSCGSLNIVSLTGIEAFKALTTLNCSNNNVLAEVDLSANTALTSLNCSYNMLSKLNLANCAGLRTLTISYNPLEEIILHPSASLSSLLAATLRTSDAQIYSSKLKVVGAGLTSISCYKNRLTELDVAACTKITSLNCYDNQLTEIDLSGNRNLKTLNCYNNKLEALDVSINTALTSINCNTNALKTLDVSTNLQVTTLNCSTNPDLTTLYMAEGQTIRTLTKDAQTEIVRK